MTGMRALQPSDFRSDGMSRRGRTAVLLLVVFFLAFPGLWLPLAIITMPLWLRVINQYRFAWTIVVSLMTMLASGLVLLSISEGEHDPVATKSTLVLVVRAGLIFAVLLWARKSLGARWTAIAYCSGALGVALIQHFPNFDALTIKYFYAWPLMVILIAWQGGRRNIVIWMLANFAFIMVALQAEYRSALAFWALAMLLIVIQRMFNRHPSSNRRAGAFAVTIVAAATVLLTTYFLLERVLVAGWLGEDLQRKTLEQVREYGSLLAGGRVEAPLAWNLLTAHPSGFGPGFIPTSREYGAAVSSAVLESNRYYVDGYMFAGQIKLHSFWGDLWVNFGVVGLLVAFLLGIIVSAQLWRQMQQRTTNVLVIFLGVWVVWNLCFSPIYSNLVEELAMFAIILESRQIAVGTKSMRTTL